MKLQAARDKVNSVRWGFWFGVTFFVVVVSWIVILAMEIKQKAVDDNKLPVREVKLLGDRSYTLDEEVLRVLPEEQMRSFIALDVDEVQRRIEELPWVKSASIRKQWPDILQVHLTEQKPVAHWNGDLMLNDKGEAFQLDAYKVTEKLPQLFGPEGSEAEALKGFNDLQQLLAFGEREIEEMTLTERYSWLITLDDQVQLNLGREDKIKRMQRFIDFYPQLIADERDVAYVDLRYDTGFAVGWKEKKG